MWAIQQIRGVSVLAIVESIGLAFLAYVSSESQRPTS